MSFFNSSYNVGGVSYWTGFDTPADGSPVRPFSTNRPSFQPGSHKPTFDSAFWRGRGIGADDANAVEQEIYTIDFLKDENKKAHHTEKCGMKNLVVRRGQDFKLKVNLNVPFNKDQDRLQIMFSKGDKPQESKGSLIRVDLYNDIKSAQKAKRNYDWLGYITSSSTTATNAEVSVTIKSNSDALVGTYKVRTNFYKTDLNGKQKRFVREEEEEEVYVLFNAWNKDDQVYMENAADREEYVLNETGKIWVGSANWNSGRAWNFGQFSKTCMTAAVYLLDHSYLAVHAHGNATLVCRAMSSMANSNDLDQGVLSGNWSGKYEGGTSPSKWVGSVKILEEYMETKRQVKYGQCWVFSGLLTTLCRALGIPTRSVTNFDSAHDSDYSMTIDTHISSEDGEKMDHLDDSVWNFHVWNEAYFKRPDLPKGYDGWQAFDATPQESSDGIMQCGPAPLAAIKEGNVFLGYDTKFIFAEVNADRVTWMVDPKGDMTPVKDKTQKSSVGNQISTKAVGANRLNEVTDLYKFKEGTTEEREVVTRATSFSSRRADLADLYRETTDDVDISWTYTTDKGDINVTLTMQNKSTEARKVFVRATANATYYTGATGEKLGDTRGTARLQPGQKTENLLKLKAEAYLNMIDADAKVKMLIFAKVYETKQVFCKEETIEVEKPEPVLELSNTRPKVGEKFTLTIKTTNPVKVQLTNSVIHMEGPGITKTKEILHRRPVDVGEEISETVTLTAKYPGKRELIVVFNCRQLTSITGSVEVNVQDK